MLVKTIQDGELRPYQNLSIRDVPRLIISVDFRRGSKFLRTVYVDGERLQVFLLLFPDTEIEIEGPSTIFT